MFDPRRIVEQLREEALHPPAPPVGGWPVGAPVQEYTRSPAAARIARLAAADGLFLFHYEHCAWREIPEEWLPPERSDLAEPPTWSGGVLSEPKYHAFRHDQATGGFHPGQRAKWSTHELCHGLVGYAWRADATPFFHATAGRLAELLPVALWYFFDEAFLQRCPAHVEDGALFRTYCAACDRVAAPRVDDADAEARVRDGLRFLDRELAAIARSRRGGRPYPNTWASIDLASDGVAYAGAHAARLGDDAFRCYMDRFAVRDGGWSETLDALEARIIAVAGSLLEGRPLAPLAPSRAHGTARWTLQDVGWRLLSVWRDTADEAAETLMNIVDGLAATTSRTVLPSLETAECAAALREAIMRYAALEEEYVLPSTEEVFSVGYDLVDGHGRSLRQVIDGVRSATPLAVDALADDLRKEVEEFLAHDGRGAALDRAVLGARWATHVAAKPAVGDLARYEAALVAAAPGDEVASALGPVGVDGRVRLAEGLGVHRFGCDVVALAEQVESGEAWFDGERFVRAAGPFPAADTALVIGRLGGGELVVLDIAPATASAIVNLGDGAVPALEADEAQSLRDLGVLVPAAWGEHVDVR